GLQQGQKRGHERPIDEGQGAVLVGDRVPLLGGEEPPAEFANGPERFPTEDDDDRYDDRDQGTRRGGGEPPEDEVTDVPPLPTWQRLPSPTRATASRTRPPCSGRRRRAASSRGHRSARRIRSRRASA